MAGPPPPPPGPPPPSFGSSTTSKTPMPADRNALLASIRQGASLKKTETDDRSAPKVGGGVIESGTSNKPVTSAPAVPKSTSAPGGMDLNSMLQSAFKAKKMHASENSNNNDIRNELKLPSAPPIPGAPPSVPPPLPNNVPPISNVAKPKHEDTNVTPLNPMAGGLPFLAEIEKKRDDVHVIDDSSVPAVSKKNASDSAYGSSRQESASHNISVPQIPSGVPKAPELPSGVPAAPPIPSGVPKAPELPSGVPAAPPLPSSVPKAPELPSSVPAAPPIPSGVPAAPPLPSSVPKAPELPSSVQKAPPLPSGVPAAPPIPSGVPAAPPIPSGVPAAPPIPSGVPAAPPIPSGVPAAPPIPSGVPAAPPLPSSVPEEPPLPSSVPDAPPLPSSVPKAPELPSSVQKAPPLPSGVPKAPPLPSGVPAAPPLPSSIPKAPPLPSSVPDAPPLPSGVSVAPPLPSNTPQAPAIPSSVPAPPSFSSMGKNADTVKTPPANPLAGGLPFLAEIQKKRDDTYVVDEKNVAAVSKEGASNLKPDERKLSAGAREPGVPSMPPPMQHTAPRAPSIPSMIPTMENTALAAEQTQEDRYNTLQARQDTGTAKKAPPPPPAVESKSTGNYKTRLFSDGTVASSTVTREGRPDEQLTDSSTYRNKAGMGTQLSEVAIPESTRFKWQTKDEMPIPRPFLGKTKLYPSGRGSSVPLNLKLYG